MSNISMSRILSLSICIAIGLTLFVASSSAQAQHTTDSLETVRKGLADNTAILLDVREQREWNAGHLADAKLLPLSKLRAGIDPKELVKIIPKGKTVYCHCRSGGRVIPASTILRELGYDVRPLKYGYSALLQSGFDKAKP